MSDAARVMQANPAAQSRFQSFQETAWYGTCVVFFLFKHVILRKCCNLNNDRRCRRCVPVLSVECPHIFPFLYISL
jgi:hypothetical protein